MMFPELRLGRGKIDVLFMAECSPLILTTMASHEPRQLFYPLQKEASLAKAGSITCHGAIP